MVTLERIRTPDPRIRNLTRNIEFVELTVCMSHLCWIGGPVGSSHQPHYCGISRWLRSLKSTSASDP